MGAIYPAFNPELQPPKLRHSILEFSRVLAEIGSTALLGPVLKTLPRGDGHSIMTIPGFMGADGSMAQLRKFLNNRGYKAIPWGLGRNSSEVRPSSLDDFLAHREKVEDQIAARVEKEFVASGRKVTLIGWSLGGLYSVAIAHRFPQWIRQVITLGTPYGDPRGTALYNVMERIYDNKVEVDEASLERWTAHTYRGGELTVPVLALYSKTDGIVGEGIAQCQADPAYVKNVAVIASHVGFPFNPIVFAVIANHMVAPQYRWAICRNKNLKKRLRSLTGVGA
ncbi:MAG: pimeloyl-ACP methyl ester carboxylesterase [Halioglobus sp.]|jgi:pimeloyl-ACP methyl ester carboxylesterase